MTDNIEMVRIDPDELILEDNVRTDTKLDKQFLASIKESGVLVPVVAVRGEDGTLKVRMGQRRTLAAQQTGIESIPVYITEEGDEADRLIEQIIENDHRLALKQTERVVAYQQLLDMPGMSPTKIAKRLSVSLERVKNSAAAAKSELAMELLGQGQASLEEAAAIAEFEKYPRYLDELKRDVGTRYFKHTLERLRQQVIDAAAWKKACEPFEKAGYRVLDEPPRGFDASLVPLDQLRDADGNELEGPTDNPEHWAVYVDDVTAFVDESGEPVDETTIDWSTEGKPDKEPAEGKRHADTVREDTTWQPLWYCLDPEAAGLTVSDRFAGLSSAQAGLKKDGPLDPAAEAAKQEAERRERRKTIALNKAAAAAESVRIDFVKNLLKRKTAPKGAAVFVAQMLVRDAHLLSSYKADTTATELLGVGSGIKSDLVNALDGAAPASAEVITLGLVLGALEGRSARDGWRGGSKESYIWAPGTKDYLEFLVSQGYALSPVEEIIVGARDADEVFDELTHTHA